MTRRDRFGAIVTTLTRKYGPTFFEQTTVDTFLGAPPSNNDSVLIKVDSGSLFIYGAATDNITQNPSMQIGRK